MLVRGVRVVGRRAAEHCRTAVEHCGRVRASCPLVTELPPSSSSALTSASSPPFRPMVTTAPAASPASIRAAAPPSLSPSSSSSSSPPPHAPPSAASWPPPSLPVLPPAHPALLHSLTEVSALLASGALTSLELTQAALDRIAAVNPVLNAFISVLPDRALAQARAADSRARAGTRLSPLDGVPIAVKDNFCVADTHTTAGSAALASFVAPYSATVVARLEAAGAVIVGKTNMDEFGMGSHSQYSVAGPTLSPLTATVSATASAARAPRSAGGSSGGSAAAVAAHACFAALGSDTGGSVRLPAAYCGLVGLKPGYGRVSRHGLIAYASSLDCPGVLARSTADAAAVFAAIQGPDPLDSTAILPASDSSPTPSSSPFPSASPASTTRPLAGVRVAVPRELMVAELPHVALAAWRASATRLAQLGASLVWVSLPALETALPVYYTLASAEAVSNLSRYDGVRYGPSTFRHPRHGHAAVPPLLPLLAEDMAPSPFTTTTTTTTSTAAATLASVSAAGESRARTIEAALGQAFSSSSAAASKGSAVQALYTANRSALLGPEVRRRITVGNYVLASAQYRAFVAQAMRLRTRLVDQLLRVLTPHAAATDTAEDTSAHGEVFLLLPTAATVAPTVAALRDGARARSPVTAYLDDVFTVFPSLAGLPAVSVPAVTPNEGRQRTEGKGDDEEDGEGLPLGMQLVGAPLSEMRLLQVARLLEDHARE